jgi:hypothetical protein
VTVVPAIWLGAGTAALLLAAGLPAVGDGMAVPPGERPAQSILFMTGRDWQHSRAADKIALSAEFMRVFCVSPAMAPKRLADCLDGLAGTGPLFDRAIDCSKQIDAAD